jgi:hypothetical protein
MYVIRRVWVTKSRQARQVASLVAEIGGIYEEAGQRENVRVYFNGGTLPGERDVVYMEWTAPVIDSPYRGGNVLPDTGAISQKVRDLTEDSWIEFYELLTAEKAVPIE